MTGGPGAMAAAAVVGDRRPGASCGERAAADRLLAHAPAGVRVVEEGTELPPDRPRSYLGDGRAVLWAAGRPRRRAAGLRGAVDAEIADRPVPRSLAARYGCCTETFWPRWTAVEVSCKLRDIPVPVWLREHGLLPDPALAVRTFRLDDLVISCGVAGQAD